MRHISLGIFMLVILQALNTYGAQEHPDKLYEMGRFTEAEEAYAKADMDHPKDFRFRYNRGCAAYQNSDFDGAMAAFSSVLRRADNDDVRFKATFNLGNAAFKKGDFQSAAAYFKQALALNPSNEDARFNLELALRTLGKEKQAENENQEQRPTENKNDQSRGQGDGKEKEQPQDQKAQGEENRASTPNKAPSDSPGKAQDTGDNTKATASPSQVAGNQKPAPRQTDKAGETPPPQDLDGELQPMKALPRKEGEEPPEDQGRGSLDKKKADAFLNNINEDQSRFLQFKMRGQGSRGVASGKDW